MTTDHEPANAWDIYGDTVLPWDIGRPQPAFVELAEAGDVSGRVLDVGCGTGEHVLMAASLGLDATGIDIAPSAIALARDKARERGLQARFLVADALRLEDLDERFDSVLDSGLFHTLSDTDRAVYVRALAAVVSTGGRYHMLCFSEREPGFDGPRRVTQEEIRASFADGWHVDTIDAVSFETSDARPDVLAWRASLTRL